MRVLVELGAIFMLLQTIVQASNVICAVHRYDVQELHRAGSAQDGGMIT